jgi:hypothetical protein
LLEPRAVRLRTADGNRIQGTLAGHADGVVHIVGDSSYTVPIAAITTVEHRQPLSGPWFWKGSLMGASLLGGLMAVALASDDDSGCDVDPDFCAQVPAAGWITWGVLVGGAAGGVLGAILGSHVTGWRAQQW